MKQRLLSVLLLCVVSLVCLFAAEMVLRYFENSAKEKLTATPDYGDTLSSKVVSNPISIFKCKICMVVRYALLPMPPVFVASASLPWYPTEA